jgi:hypothetical protein
MEHKSLASPISSKQVSAHVLGFGTGKAISRVMAGQGQQTGGGAGKATACGGRTGEASVGIGTPGGVRIGGGNGAGITTCGGAGIDGCGRISIASTTGPPSIGIGDGITMMMATFFAILLMNGQTLVFVALVFSLQQHLPLLPQQQSLPLPHPHLLSLQHVHFSSHCLLVQQHSSSLQHFPSLQQSPFVQLNITSQQFPCLQIVGRCPTEPSPGAVCAQTTFPSRVKIAAVIAACQYRTNISYASFSPRGPKHFGRGETITKEAGHVSSNRRCRLCPLDADFFRLGKGNLVAPCPLC